MGFDKRSDVFGVKSTTYTLKIAILTKTSDCLLEVSDVLVSLIVPFWTERYGVNPK